jgi:hypothetical protein
MTDEVCIWLRHHWFNFREGQSRSPDKTEWWTLVQGAVRSPEDPLTEPCRESLEELVQESFQAFDIADAMAGEISRKFRDAYTNWYCRKYVDGSF